MATLNQIEMLKKIVNSDYQYTRNPESHEDTATWTFDVIDSPADKGTIGSMVKAGLVETWEDGDEAIRMTEEGFKVYQANK